MEGNVTVFWYFIELNSGKWNLLFKTSVLKIHIKEHGTLLFRCNIFICLFCIYIFFLNKVSWIKFSLGTLESPIATGKTAGDQQQTWAVECSTWGRLLGKAHGAHACCLPARSQLHGPCSLAGLIRRDLKGIDTEDVFDKIVCQEIFFLICIL